MKNCFTHTHTHTRVVLRPKSATVIYTQHMRAHACQFSRQHTHFARDTMRKSHAERERTAWQIVGNKLCACGCAQGRAAGGDRRRRRRRRRFSALALRYAKLYSYVRLCTELPAILPPSSPPQQHRLLRRSRPAVTKWVIGVHVHVHEPRTHSVDICC